nr:hypothetical protein [Tanacetum cinerariifolium]
MTFITAQQTKLDLELVPKENRLDIVKCNRRIPHSKLTKRKDSNLLWKSLEISFKFAPELKIKTLMPFPLKKTLYHFSKKSVILGLSIHSMMLLSIRCINREELLLLLSTKAYLERPLLLTNFVFPENISFGKRSISEIWSCLPECLTSPQMKESKAYKTYLGYATRTVPSKVAKKFKKASPSKKDSVPVPADEEPIQKGKRVKRSAKKSSTTPTTGIVIREPPVETQSKRKEKSLRDFHKSHPSGSGLVAENPPSVDKITPPVTSVGTGDKPGVPDVTKDESTESESESWGNDEDDSNNEKGSEQENDSEKHESDFKQDTDGSKSDSKSDQQDNDDDEVKDVDDDNNDDKSEGDEDRGMDSDDVQDKKANSHCFGKDVAELKNDPLHTQVTTLVDDYLDTRMGATRKEFMNFLSASLTDRITEQVKNQMPQILPEEVSNFAPPVIEKMIQESLDQILIDKMNSSESCLTAPEHRECYDGLIKSYNLDKDFFSSYDVYSLKRSRDDKDKDEGPSTRSDRGLKKKSIHAEEPEFKVGDTDTPQGQEGNQGNDNYEPRTESASRRAWFTKPLRPTFRLFKGTHSNYAELEYDFKECYKALSEKLDWENPEGADYPFDLSKRLPLITRGNRQSVPIEFFINNDLKYLQGGISTMTYTTSTTKTKAAQYDLPGIKDMVPDQNICL